MLHLIFYLIAVMALLQSCSAVGIGPAKLEASPGNAADAEEYAVYSSIVKSMYIGGTVSMIAILDETCAFINGSNISSEEIQQISNNLSGLDEETFDDFLAKNTEPHKLEEKFDLGYTNYVLLSKDQVMEIFGNYSGWGLFYRIYPDSQGVMTLSGIGFNQNATQALAYVGNQMHWASGAGYYVLLSKEDDRWIIKHQKTAWIA